MPKCSARITFTAWGCETSQVLSTNHIPEFLFDDTEVMWELIFYTIRSEQLLWDCPLIQNFALVSLSLKQG